MNAAQLAVERDRLLEGGRTPEEVDRMQAIAADGDVWVVLKHYDYEGEDVRAICLSEADGLACMRHAWLADGAEGEFDPRGEHSRFIQSSGIGGELWLVRMTIDAAPTPSSPA